MKYFKGTIMTFIGVISMWGLSANAMEGCSQPDISFEYLGKTREWAACNVGASNPSDYGNFFQWGNNTPNYDSSNPSDYGDFGNDASWDFGNGASSPNLWGGGTWDGFFNMTPEMQQMVKGPCAEGYHVPTDEDVSAVSQPEGVDVRNSIPLGGYKNADYPTVHYDVETVASIWTVIRNVDDVYVYSNRAFDNPSGLYQGSNINEGWLRNVRCVKNPLPPVIAVPSASDITISDITKNGFRVSANFATRPIPNSFRMKIFLDNVEMDTIFFPEGNLVDMRDILLNGNAGWTLGNHTVSVSFVDDMQMAEGAKLNVVINADWLERPSNFRTVSSSDNSITIAWDDTVTGEEGFKIRYMQLGGIFKTFIAPANSTGATITGLSPSTEYFLYEMWAYKGTIVSENQWPNNGMISTTGIPDESIPVTGDITLEQRWYVYLVDTTNQTYATYTESGVTQALTQTMLKVKDGYLGINPMLIVDKLVSPWGKMRNGTYFVYVPFRQTYGRVTVANGVLTNYVDDSTSGPGTFNSRNNYMDAGINILSWDASTNATSYKIIAFENSLGNSPTNYIEVAEVPAGGSLQFDMATSQGLKAGTMYSFFVTAYNSTLWVYPRPLGRIKTIRI